MSSADFYHLQKALATVLNGDLWQSGLNCGDQMKAVGLGGTWMQEVFNGVKRTGEITKLFTEPTGFLNSLIRRDQSSRTWVLT